MNIVKTSTMFVRFLKFTFLKLISAITVFLVSVVLKLTKFHRIKGNNSFRLQHFSTGTWYLAVNRSNINLKALQIGLLEESFAII